MKNVVLLTGPRSNCGDYLIADRARRLFAHFLPRAVLTEINRLRPYGQRELAVMENAGLVVLVGGPLIRGNCAEALNLAPLVDSGWLDRVRTPFVIMGGGAKPKEPFAPSRLRLTPATRGLFDKLERSPYYSGTRDFESLALLRNEGYGNFRFTGCPALYALNEMDRMPRAFRLDEVRSVVFSVGAPGGLNADAVRQHLSVCAMLAELFPQARRTVAFHHPIVDAEVCQRIADAAVALGCEIADISGGLECMEALYRGADLHVGYLVHAHVLMTSWCKWSVLLAEDGRASGMADVISGRVFGSWRKTRRGFLGIPARWCPPLLQRTARDFDGRLAEKIAAQLRAASTEAVALNVVKVPGFEAMRAWFGQFLG